MNRGSHTIPVAVLVRSYELWMSTDLSIREIARAVGVNYRTLHQAIKIAELKGLYGGHLPARGGTVFKVIDCITTGGGLTSPEVQNITGLGKAVARQAIYTAYRRGLVSRRKLCSRDRYYIYEAATATAPGS